MKHKHHIIPVHVGGSNDPSNIVYLTLEEHAEAHRKLYEECGRWQDKLAWMGLSGRIGKEEIIRLKASLQMTSRLKYGDLKGIHTGRKRSIQFKEKVSKTLTGKKFSNTHKIKISDSLKGKPKSDRHRKSLSESCKGLDRASKTYLVTFPGGLVQEVKNLTRFAIDQGFPKTSLFNLITGQSKSYRGFKVKKLNQR